ncbi:MAG: hydrogenase maturation nickel metallochaperone HypA [Firmicutes bacterium]|nr:hydrogenase maturation nickel metallochaperone HypA [Bacillota bacterium]
MHELSIALSLLDLITEECQKHGVERLKKIKVVAGELAGVVPEALKFSFEVVSEGTVAEGAELEVEVRPLQAVCQDCGAEFIIENMKFRCPQCRSRDLKRSAGDELFIDYLETAD